MQTSKFDLDTVSRMIQAIKTRTPEMAKIWNPQTLKTIQFEIDKLPHGSGIDGTNSLDIDLSTPDKLVFKIPYHHMDENGFYAGWDDFKIIVTPSFRGPVVKVRYYSIGSDIPRQQRIDTKEYLGDLFHEFFNEI